jgi:hypothetical protein
LFQAATPCFEQCEVLVLSHRIIGLLMTPLVPGGQALLDQCDVLVVSHGIIQGREAACAYEAKK